MKYLILSCSNKKTAHNTPVKAIELYNGVFFSVYKKAVRNDPDIESSIKLLIVSAKYGLIESTDVISYYDKKMNLEIAHIQRQQNTLKLQALIDRETPESITVVMGKTYLESIDFSAVSPPVHIINGEIGIMLHGLKAWLEANNRGDINAN